MNRELLRVIIALGLQLLATFAEGAFDKAAENERKERRDD